MTKKLCLKRSIYFDAYGSVYCVYKGEIKAWRRYKNQWELLHGLKYTDEQLISYLKDSWKQFSKDNPPEGVQVPCPW